MDSIAEHIPIIELKNIRYSYSKITPPVLNGLNFSFRYGERIAIVGPNGSGKTTLFHIIMGLLKPYEGEVFIFGKSRKDKDDFYEVRRKIGLLFQDSDDQLFSPTVVEDVAFGPLNIGIPKNQVRAIVSDVLNSLGLSGYEDRITYKLSGGEKRLVALATVLAMKPDVLLLDEPVLGLDEEHKERIINVLKNHRGGYIVISHDKDFVNRTVEKRYVLKNGRLAEA